MRGLGLITRVHSLIIIAEWQKSGNFQQPVLEGTADILPLSQQIFSTYFPNRYKLNWPDNWPKISQKHSLYNILVFKLTIYY